MKKIPVFLINGFLDAGKTQFILSTIRRDEFYINGKTLLVSFEQGETPYDEEELKRYNTKIVYFENKEDFKEEKLIEYVNDFKPKRIVLEYNFLWDINTLTLSNNFIVSQIITIVDGSTFPIYYSNMRQQFNDAFKISDVVAFTKLNDDISSLAPYETGLKMINSQCLYCLIDENCISTKEAFETPLPYDIEQDEITIEDKDFGIFYIDTFKNRNAYEGKIVTFNAWVVKSNKLNKDEFIAGRKVLTCCANDIQLYGFLSKSSLSLDLKDDSWIRITAKCHVEYNKNYDEEELTLIPIDITIIPEIKDPVLDLR